MTKIPPRMNSIAALIDQWWEENKQSKHRPHLGASIAGHPCDRWLWLSFRWVIKPKHGGRLLRLFDRGQREEKTAIENLKSIGCQFLTPQSTQHSVHLGCHVSGSADGIIEKGVPDSPNKPHVLEIKTHGKKSFTELVKKEDVEEAKPRHFAQMQLYMHGLKIDRALYYAVCKDDDEIYTERVKYNKEFAEKLLARVHEIALSKNMPPGISTDPSWYQCKWCNAHSFCHETQMSDEYNCRTCLHCVAKKDSTFVCKKFHNNKIPDEFQRQGCKEHDYHRDLVDSKVNEVRDFFDAEVKANQRIEKGD